MPTENQSLESLFSQLTSFSLEQDAEFRRGENDFVERIRRVGHWVGTLYNEGLDADVPLYDEKVIRFTAERIPSLEKDDVSIIGHFTIKLETTTHVDTIPLAIRPYIDIDTVDAYDETEPDEHNLIVSFSTEYSVERAYDVAVDITRNMTYALYDNKDILYQTSETDESGKFEAVAIAHEQQTLLVRRPVQEETVADVAEQLQFNIQFDDLFDGKNVEFYSEFLAARDQDAIISIRSLLRSLKVGSATPTI